MMPATFARPLLALRGVGRHFGGGVFSRGRVVAVDDVDLEMRGGAP
jgi:hypothetical protein